MQAMTLDERRVVRQAALDKLLGELNASLQHRHYYSTHSAVRSITGYHVPASVAGSRWDHTMVVIVYADGSFATYMGDGRHHIGDSVAALKAMMVAADKVPDSAASPPASSNA